MSREKDAVVGEVPVIVRVDDYGQLEAVFIYFDPAPDHRIDVTAELMNHPKIHETVCELNSEWPPGSC